MFFNVELQTLVAHFGKINVSSQTWFMPAIITNWLDRHVTAEATHLVDYSGVHEASYFSSKRRLCWNLPLRTQGQRPESQALYAHAKHATPVSSPL